MSWLDQFLLAVRQVAQSGVGFPQRSALNFSGAGVVVSDDETNDRTNVVIAGGAGGITTLTGDVTASGSGSVAATVARIQGTAINSAVPTNGQVLTYAMSLGKWTPMTPASPNVTSINISCVNAYGTIAAGTPVCAWGSSNGAVVPATAAWSSYSATTIAPIGIATNSTANGGDQVDVCIYGEATVPSLAGNGVPVFVPNSAGVAVQYSALSGGSGTYRIIRLGTMTAATKMLINIVDLGLNP